MSGLDAVLLAAGQSKRMGSVNKLLLPIEGECMVRRVAQALLAGGVDRVLAVLGYQASAVDRVLPDEVRRLVHPGFEAGMGSSIACGVSALPSTTEGIMVALGDLPWLSAVLVRRLVQAFRERPIRASIVAPRVGGRRGHPLLFAPSHRAALEACAGDEGARFILDRAADEIHWVDWEEDEGPVADVDEPGDQPASSRQSGQVPSS